MTRVELIRKKCRAIEALVSVFMGVISFVLGL
jgi:hypothetical protein